LWVRPNKIDRYLLIFEANVIILRYKFYKYLIKAPLMSEASKQLSDKAANLRLEGKNEEALLAAKGAVNLDPDSANAWWELGLSSDALNKTDAAIEAFEKTIQLSDEFARGWGYYGKALRAAGRKDDAIRACERALELDETEQIALIQLMAIYDGDNENRSKFIKYLVTYDENYGLTLSSYINVLGNHYLREGNNHLALTCYKRVFDEPDFPYGRHNAGLAYYQLAQLLNALDIWAINLKENPDYEASADEYGKKLLMLRERAKLISEQHRIILPPSEWFENYLSPFLLLEFESDAELDNIEPRIIQAFRKKMLQEIDLEDGKISWMDDFVIDKSRAIGISDELNNPELFEFHAIIFKYKPLLDFLSKGDITFFLSEPLDDLLEVLEQFNSNTEFAKWITPYFAKQFDNVFKKSISKPEIYFALLGGRLLVTDERLDDCFTASRQDIDKLLIPLRDEAKTAEHTKPSYEKIKTLIEKADLAKKLKALPVQFIDLQNEAPKIIRSIAIDTVNTYNDSEESKKLLELSKTFTFYNSSIQKKLDEDTKDLERIISNEKQDESTLTFGELVSSIKKEGIRHGDTFIPADKVETVRWGTTIVNENYKTTLKVSMVVTGNGKAVNLGWNAASETDQPKVLFDKHVNALMSYLFPPLLERIKKALDSGETINIGPWNNQCKLTKYGAQFKTKGWFSDKTHNVSWSKLKVNLSQGMLQVFSIDNYSDKIELPFKDTDNAFALYILATSDER
jgi:tetratricopeptide (TPR) repeat protein